MKRDRFIIRALEARCILGVYDWERDAPRSVVIDLEFPLDPPAPRGSDEPFVDYARVAAEVKERMAAAEPPRSFKRHRLFTFMKSGA